MRRLVFEVSNEFTEREKRGICPLPSAAEKKKKKKTSSPYQLLDPFPFSTNRKKQRVWSTDSFLGRPAIVKQRFPKKYRHPTLDARLTQQRVRAEARATARARRLGVRSPALFHVDVEASTIVMERLRGRPLRDVLRDLQREASEGASGGSGGGGKGNAEATAAEAATAPATAERVQALMASVGRAVARLHDGGLVHGDLTTLNLFVMMEEEEGEKEAGSGGGKAKDEPEIAVIDFGLSSNSTLPEDRGVDLYVLERALGAAHAASGPLFEPVEAAYRQHSKGWAAALARFREVRLRGRKRAMIG